MKVEMKTCLCQNYICNTAKNAQYFINGNIKAWCT